MDDVPDVEGVALSALPFRTLRIFVSSTFTEFHVERARLAMVQQQLNLRLQGDGVRVLFVDLRWGVAAPDGGEPVGLDLITERCLAEVAISDVVLAFLGGRYGTARVTTDSGEMSLTELEIRTSHESSPSAGPALLAYIVDDADTPLEEEQDAFRRWLSGIEPASTRHFDRSAPGYLQRFENALIEDLTELASAYMSKNDPSQGGVGETMARITSALRVDPDAVGSSHDVTNLLDFLETRERRVMIVRTEDRTDVLGLHCLAEVARRRLVGPRRVVFWDAQRGRDLVDCIDSFSRQIGDSSTDLSRSADLGSAFQRLRDVAGDTDVDLFIHRVDRFRDSYGRDADWWYRLGPASCGAIVTSATGTAAMSIGDPSRDDAIFLANRLAELHGKRVGPELLERLVEKPTNRYQLSMGVPLEGEPADPDRSQKARERQLLAFEDPQWLYLALHLLFSTDRADTEELARAPLGRQQDVLAEWIEELPPTASGLVGVLVERASAAWSSQELANALSLLAACPRGVPYTRLVNWTAAITGCSPAPAGATAMQAQLGPLVRVAADERLELVGPWLRDAVGELFERNPGLDVQFDDFVTSSLREELSDLVDEDDLLDLLEIALRRGDDSLAAAVVTSIEPLSGLAHCVGHVLRQAITRDRSDRTKPYERLAKLVDACPDRGSRQKFLGFVGGVLARNQDARLDHLHSLLAVMSSHVQDLVPWTMATLETTQSTDETRRLLLDFNLMITAFRRLLTEAGDLHLVGHDQPVDVSAALTPDAIPSVAEATVLTEVRREVIAGRLDSATELVDLTARLPWHSRLVDAFRLIVDPDSSTDVTGESGRNLSLLPPPEDVLFELAVARAERAHGAHNDAVDRTLAVLQTARRVHSFEPDSATKLWLYQAAHLSYALALWRAGQPGTAQFQLDDCEEIARLHPKQMYFASRTLFTIVVTTRAMQFNLVARNFRSARALLRRVYATVDYALPWNERSLALLTVRAIAESVEGAVEVGFESENTFADDEWNRRGEVVQGAVSFYRKLSNASPKDPAWARQLAQAFVAEANWLTASGQRGRALERLERAATLLDERADIDGGERADLRTAIAEAAGVGDVGVLEPDGRLAGAVRQQHVDMIREREREFGLLFDDPLLDRLGLVAVADPPGWLMPRVAEDLAHIEFA